MEDSYCSFEALELGFAALQSGRDGAEVGRQYGVHGGAQKRLWAEDHRLHGERLQQGASERFCHECSSLWWSAAARRRKGETRHHHESLPGNLFRSRRALT